MNGKVVAVTGGFGTLGSAVARAFAAGGAAVVLIDVGKEVPSALQSVAEGRSFFSPGTDLTNLQSARAALDAAASKLGGIDVLVNVAGGFRWQTLADGDIATWDLMYALNLKTAVVATKAALPHLLRRGAGRVINVGAGAAATRAGAGMGAYTASKAGVQRFTESLAAELKDHAITVNAVLPGTIDTPQNRADMPKADFTRWVMPAELADVIVFLASDAARAVTGASIPVFGRGVD